MKNDVLELKIESDAFSALKGDFNAVLKRTLKSMLSKNSSQAEMTIKLNLVLAKDNVPNFDVGDDTREIVKPTISHKVSSVMKIKDEQSGSIKGDYELVYDENIDDFVMRPVDNGQTSFFSDDDDYDYVTVDDEDEETSDEELALEAGKKLLGAASEIETEDYPDEDE